MEKIILVGGKAGLGATMTSTLLGKIFSKMGYYVFNYRDYPSLIRGGHNFNILKISTEPVFSHDEEYDIIIAFDQITIDLHEKNLKSNGIILGDSTLKSSKLIKMNLKKLTDSIEAKTVLSNDALIGALLKLLDLDIDEAIMVIETTFKDSDKIIEIIKLGYGMVDTKFKMECIKKEPNYFLTGNEAISLGAIAAGLDVYIAYPMTPATGVLHEIARLQKKHNVLSVQIEDEIGVANSALGCSFAGAKTMIGTSGGGFDLMTEALSLQGIVEIPLVVYLSQRTGPSTGVPTYTEQGDLKMALSCGHGEFPRIILAPGDADECFYRTAEALYLAEKYRMLVILLGDKHIGENNYTVNNFSKIIDNKKFIISPRKDYKNYEYASNGVSARAVPGFDVVVKVNSYEHDEYGNTIEDAETTKKMKEKRVLKMATVAKEIEKLNPASIYGAGENLIIGWGSTKGAIIDTIKDLKNYRFLQVNYLWPFPIKAISDEIKKSKTVVLVENNQTGQLGNLIKEQTGFEIKNKLLRYDGRPFTKNDIIKGVSKWK
ncbi:MAG: 2-oxoacid:acceptor oxidoreductase subunit alpha [Nanoarchaeota archaeon]|nr:2-oxoacid:acceptor oxidoreductase subunit alpha [Nanoarchaeota archaeon]MBU4124571.1 2-oxoacid:acceptor oxidoreductase subunit alpha [Nanoarchaeota archaeon]